MKGKLTTRLASALACAALALATGVAARADDPPSCSSSTAAPYSLALTALTGPQGTDVVLDVDAAAGCAAAETLKKVQLKVFAADGTVGEVRNLTDVDAPGGVADIELGELARDLKIEAEVLVQTGTPVRTYVVRGETRTRSRPDLVVAAVHAPLQTLTTRPVDVLAEISEENGDTAATATVTLSWGPSPLATANVEVPAGGTVSVPFAGVALTTPVPVELSVIVSDVTPAETDATNNTRTATVDVTENELARSRLILESLGGFGAQFNQHVFAPITSPPPATLPDFEAKAKALEPQFVRIFYNDDWEELRTTAPQNFASFVETVKLAQEAGATINITYHTLSRAKSDPAAYMARFATVLENLVRNESVTNLHWVTLQNEPNYSGNLTLQQYEDAYRALHAQLVARGLRDQIKLMGGDLVERGDAVIPDQRTWFAYMAEHMNDILDAYSVHIYWNYWDIPRMEFRLRDVRHIVTEELPENARKPTYITEFGVRGLRPGVPPLPQPGVWEDGTMLARTNIAAFQQLWFDLETAQLGYSGTSKWDAYWGTYDGSYRASHWLIGPAAEGWPLMPSYHALRLLFQTTAKGWHVLGVDPWATDDWQTGIPDQSEKEVAAYAGPDNELTLVGLDSHGRALNAVSAEKPSYSVGGLPANTRFNLAVWNANGDGTNTLSAEVATNAAGVARFEVPLHAAFALTTVPVA